MKAKFAKMNREARLNGGSFYPSNRYFLSPKAMAEAKHTEDVARSRVKREGGSYFLFQCGCGCGVSFVKRKN